MAPLQEKLLTSEHKIGQFSSTYGKEAEKGQEVQVSRQLIPGKWTNHSKTAMLDHGRVGQWNNQVKKFVAETETYV